MEYTHNLDESHLDKTRRTITVGSEFV